MPLESNYILQGFQLPLSQKFGENSIKAMVMSSTIDSKQPKHERFDLSDCFGSPNHHVQRFLMVVNHRSKDARITYHCSSLLSTLFTVYTAYTAYTAYITDIASTAHTAYPV